VIFYNIRQNIDKEKLLEEKTILSTIEELEALFSDKDRSEIIKKMRQLGCLELKNAKIPWSAKTNKEDRPPCKMLMSLIWN
jgi:hypothetical protein